MARGDEDLFRGERTDPNVWIVPTTIAFGLSSRGLVLNRNSEAAINTKLRINKPRGILTGGCAFKTPASKCIVDIGSPAKMEGVVGYMSSMTSTCLTGGVLQALQWTAAWVVPTVLFVGIGMYFGVKKGVQWNTKRKDRKRVMLISNPASPAPTGP